MPFLAGQTVTAADLNLATQKVIARGRRVTTSAGTTTIVGIMRLDDKPVLAGRTYKISAGPIQLDSSVANDHIRGLIKYTTDGSTPTTASATLPGAVTEGQQDNIAFGETRTIETTYTPAADETLSLLLCVQRINGTGTVTLVGSADFDFEMKIENAGEDVGDTGTDI